jgi:hypothetical protein
MASAVGWSTENMAGRVARSPSVSTQRSRRAKRCVWDSQSFHTGALRRQPRSRHDGRRRVQKRPSAGDGGRFPYTALLRQETVQNQNLGGCRPADAIRSAAHAFRAIAVPGDHVAPVPAPGRLTDGACDAGMET